MKKAKPELSMEDYYRNDGRITGAADDRTDQDRAAAKVGANVAADTIDTPEFRELFNAVGRAPWRFDGRKPAMDALITHINEWGRNLAAGAPAETPKPVATVRVTHKGYAVELSTYVAYALPEGMHDLYAAQPAPIAGDVEKDAACLDPVSADTALRELGPSCSCPSGDGSLRWPCPVHPK